MKEKMVSIPYEGNSVITWDEESPVPYAYLLGQTMVMAVIKMMISPRRLLSGHIRVLLWGGVRLF